MGLLYDYNTIYVSILLLKDICIFSVWGYREYCCYEHSFICLLVCIVHIYVGYVPWSGTVGSSVYICSIWELRANFSKVVFTSLRFCQQHMSDTIALYPCQHLIILFFWCACSAVSVWFSFSFLWLLMWLNIFSYIYWPLDVLFCEMPVLISYLLFWITWQCFFEVLNILWIQALCWLYLLKHIFLLLWLALELSWEFSFSLSWLEFLNFNVVQFISVFPLFF